MIGINYFRFSALHRWMSFFHDHCISIQTEYNDVPIVQVINKNNLRWFSHVMRRKEESILRDVMKLEIKGKRSRGRPILRQHR